MAKTAGFVVRSEGMFDGFAFLLLEKPNEGARSSCFRLYSNRVCLRFQDAGPAVDAEVWGASNAGSPR